MKMKNEIFQNNAHLSYTFIEWKSGMKIILLLQCAVLTISVFNVTFNNFLIFPFDYLCNIRYMHSYATRSIYLIFLPTVFYA